MTIVVDQSRLSWISGRYVEEIPGEVGRKTSWTDVGRRNERISMSLASVKAGSEAVGVRKKGNIESRQNHANKQRRSSQGLGVEFVWTRWNVIAALPTVLSLDLGRMLERVRDEKLECCDEARRLGALIPASCVHRLELLGTRP